MFLHIKELKYLGEYRVEVTFNDGKKGIADLSAALKGGIFEALKKTEEFANLRLDEELNTIAWANGADLAPEFVYFQAFKNLPELQTQFKEWGYI